MSFRKELEVILTQSVDTRWSEIQLKNATSQIIALVAGLLPEKRSTSNVVPVITRNIAHGFNEAIDTIRQKLKDDE